VVHILNEIVGPLVDSNIFIKREESDINSSYYKLLHHVSQYHKVILETEKKARSLVMTATLEQLQAVCTIVLKITDQLRVVERDSDLQKHLLDKMRSKFEIAAKNPEEESTKLAKISSKLIDFDHGQECNKLYINAQK
jgi:hypothetical protein